MTRSSPRSRKTGPTLPFRTSTGSWRTVPVGLPTSPSSPRSRRPARSSATVSEAVVEAHLKRRVERELGGRCEKLGGSVGIPDRLVILDRRRIWFVALKRPTGRLSLAQRAWALLLAEL